MRAAEKLGKLVPSNTFGIMENNFNKQKGAFVDMFELAPSPFNSFHVLKNVLTMYQATEIV